MELKEYDEAAHSYSRVMQLEPETTGIKQKIKDAQTKLKSEGGTKDYY